MPRAKKPKAPGIETRTVDRTAISEAAAWLIATPIQDRPRPLVPGLRRRFGITVLEACFAIREASR